MKYQLTAKSLQKIKKNLPKGGSTIIAERLNVSQSLVSLVLNGKSKNILIVETALQLIEESKKKEIELEEKINALP